MAGDVDVDVGVNDVVQARAGRLRDVGAADDPQLQCLTEPTEIGGGGGGGQRSDGDGGIYGQTVRLDTDIWTPSLSDMRGYRYDERFEISRRCFR